jgi:hypothetical protein
MSSEATRNPKVTFHRKKGHVTISGLNYNDARSLLSMASLYWYDDEKKRLANKEPEEPCSEHYHERMKFIIDTLNESFKGLIDDSWKKVVDKGKTPQQLLKAQLLENKKHRDEMAYIRGDAEAIDELPPIKVTKPIPAFGAIFKYRGKHDNEQYRCEGWARTKKPIKGKGDWIGRMLHANQQLIDGRRLEFCKREDAEYVCGSGACGCIAQVNKVRIVGMVAWPAKQIAKNEKSWLSFYPGRSID